MLSGTLLLALIWSNTLWQAQHIQEEHESKYSDQLAHLSAVFDALLARQIHSIDNSLLILREEYVEHPQDLQRMVELLRREPLKGLGVHVTVMGRAGYVEFTDLGTTALGVDLSDRPHFRYFAQGGKDRLYIGTPMQGRLTSRWGLLLARPIIGANGQFAGVVNVFLPPENLTHVARSLALDSETVVTVASGDGSILGRSRELEAYLGTSLPPPLLGYLHDKPEGVALHAQHLGMAGYSLAHRWSQDFPVLLMVSRPTRVMDEEIGGLQGQLAMLGAGASLIVLISMALLARNMRQRKEAEARLAREHTHLIEAQRIARLGSWEMDWLNNRAFMSEEIDRILDLQGRKPPASPLEYLELVHPDDRQHLQQAFETSLAQHQSGNVVHRIRTSGGQLKWLRGIWQTSYSGQGKPLRTSGTLLDITERKREQHEREALARERMLLLESTGEGILGVDTHGVCTFINQAGARMLGYAPEELVGETVQALIQPCRADGSPYPETETPLYQAYAQGIASTHEDEVFRHVDGHAIAVEYLVHPILDAQAISGAVLNFSDITHRKQTETELRIAEKAFQSQEGMFVTDERGVILRINNAFTEITGFTAEDIVGKNPRIRSSGRHDAAFYAAMWQRIRSTGAWKGEIWNRRKNGEVYPESITITAVTGKDAAVTHYVATMHDISDRKAAEEEIRHLAFYDPLTRLPNRRLLEDRLQHALMNSQRKRRHGALMFLDLDKFKELNDNWGHDAGDLLLQLVARRLLDCVRDTDTVSRLGGDEFVVLLEDLHEQAAASRLQCQQIGQKIMATLNLPYDLGGRRHRITPSVGATLFLGQAEPIEDLLKQADLAMYKAKTSGRNSLCFYAPDMLDSVLAPVSP